MLLVVTITAQADQAVVDQVIALLLETVIVVSVLPSILSRIVTTFSVHDQVRVRIHFRVFSKNDSSGS
jgi:hypothetical protein